MAGVRQGGILSPCLFAIFIDFMIRRFRAANGAYWPILFLVVCYM